MAEREETIRYVLEIDAAGAVQSVTREAQRVGQEIGRAAAASVVSPPGPAAGMPPPPAGGSAVAQQQIAAAAAGMAQLAAQGNVQAAYALARLTGVSGGVGGSFAGIGALGGGALGGGLNVNWSRLGLAAMSFAGSPGQMGSMMGLAMGGAAGGGMMVISQLLQALANLANKLQDYSAPLFAAMTQFDLKMQALSWRLGEAVGDDLARFMQAVGRLAEALVPIAEKLITLAVDVLTPVIDGMTRLVQTVNVVIAAGEVLVAWVNKQTGGVGGDLVGTIGAMGKGALNFSTSGFTSWYTEEKIRQMEKLSARIREGDQNASMQLLLMLSERIPGQNTTWRTELGVEETNKMLSGRMNYEALQRISDEYGRAVKPTDKGALSAGLESAMQKLQKAVEELTSELKDEGVKSYVPAFLGIVGAALRGGPQTPQNVLQPDSVPIPAGGAAAFFRRGNPMPMPTPAAVDFHVSDQVTIRAHDDDRLLSELLSWRDDVLRRMHGMLDGRWARLATARTAGYCGLRGGQ